jgi:hypothetical protein
LNGAKERRELDERAGVYSRAQHEETRVLES